MSKQSEALVAKCPSCGTDLPVPVLSEIRKGGVIWHDGLIGEPKLAWISKCPKEDCGYLLCKESEHLTKYPSMPHP